MDINLSKNVRVVLGVIVLVRTESAAATLQLSVALQSVILTPEHVSYIYLPTSHEQVVIDFAAWRTGSYDIA